MSAVSVEARRRFDIVKAWVESGPKHSRHPLELVAFVRAQGWPALEEEGVREGRDGLVDLILGSGLVLTEGRVYAGAPSRGEA